MRFRRGESAELLAQWREEAAAGDPEAMDSVARILSRRPETWAEAEHWWGVLAAQGNYNAMWHLAQLAIKRRDVEAAEHWFLQAAQSRDIGDMMSLARFYRGQGRLEEARVWEQAIEDAIADLPPEDPDA